MGRYEVRLWRNGRREFGTERRFDGEDEARKFARSLYVNDSTVTCVEVADRNFGAVIEVWRG